MALLSAQGPARGRRLALAAIAVLGLRASAAGAQPPASPLEAAVKANYLYKLAPFVSWPDGALVAGGAFNLCVLGEDPFGRVLDQAVARQAVGGRPIAVHRPAATAAAQGCHVVYLGRMQRSSVEDVLRRLRGAPVLTVTDQRNGGSGGMVHFVLRDGRVRFTVDARAARASGLALSSKLQALASPPQPGDGG